MGEMGKKISTVKPWKKQQEKRGKRGNMQKVEEREGDHEAGKMTGKAVYK